MPCIPQAHRLAGSLYLASHMACIRVVVARTGSFCLVACPGDGNSSLLRCAEDGSLRGALPLCNEAGSACSVCMLALMISLSLAVRERVFQPFAEAAAEPAKPICPVLVCA